MGQPSALRESDPSKRANSRELEVDLARRRLSIVELAEMVLVEGLALVLGRGEVDKGDAPAFGLVLGIGQASYARGGGRLEVRAYALLGGSVWEVSL